MSKVQLREVFCGVCGRGVVVGAPVRVSLNKCGVSGVLGVQEHHKKVVCGRVNRGNKIDVGGEGCDCILILTEN